MKAFHKPAFVALGFVLLYKPGFIVGMPAFGVVDQLYDVCRVVLILYALVCLLPSRVKLNRLTGTVILLLFNMLWEFFSTLLNGADLSSALGNNMNLLGILLFTTISLNVDEYACYKGSAYALGAYVILNLLTVLAFPGGMYATSMYKANYFLSYRNAWFPIVLVAFVVTLLWREKGGGRFSSVWMWLVLGSGVASMIIEWTATGLLCFAIGAVFLLSWRLRKKRCPISIFAVMLIELGLFVALVFLQAEDRFSFIIVDLLHKDLTLSERLRIWSSAVASVKQHFWIGIGNHSTEEVRSILQWGASHAHNFYLNRLFFFGAIGLFLSVYTLVYAGKGLYRNDADLRAKYIVTAAVIAMATAFQAESYASIWFYFSPLYLITAHLATKRKELIGIDRFGDSLPDE